VALAPDGGFLLLATIVLALVALALRPASHKGLIGSYDYVEPSSATPVHARLWLKNGGTYELCQTRCDTGRYELSPDQKDQDKIEFQGGPMPAFLHRIDPQSWDSLDRAQTSLFYSRDGIAIWIDESGGRYFTGGCYLGWTCERGPTSR
jgi:hypothetical protein